MDRVEGVEQHGQVLLGREAADAGDDQVVGAGAPLRAQRLAAARGVEAAGVDAARDGQQVAEALALQLVVQRLRRHHRALRGVVEAAQVAQDHLLHEAQTVVRAVGMEVGAELGAHRQAQRPGRQQRGAAERAFGGDVDDVGPLALPQPDELSGARQAHLQAFVTRDRHAAHEEVAVDRRGGRVGGLARAHDAHAVVARTQALHQAGHRHRHAVDFRRVGFRHAGNSQGPLQAGLNVHE